MKNHLHPQSCQQCGKSYDPEWVTCPNCGCKSREASKLFDNFAHVGKRDQILFFVIGYIGFQVFGLIMTIIVEAILSSLHPDWDMEALASAASNDESTFWINIGAYIILGIVFGIFLAVFKTHREIFRTFASKKILWGFAIFGLMIAAEEFYSVIISLIYQGIGRTLPGDGGNQSAIYEMISYSPVGCILIIGFLAPFLEELTYRVGLFGLSCRINKAWGYVITIAVFAFLHFDFFGDMETEFINLPLYLIGGACLCFAYDKFGLGASTLAHCCNNLLSVIIYIAGSA